MSDFKYDIGVEGIVVALVRSVDSTQTFTADWSDNPRRAADVVRDLHERRSRAFREANNCQTVIDWLRHAEADGVVNGLGAEVSYPEPDGEID